MPVALALVRIRQRNGAATARAVHHRDRHVDQVLLLHDALDHAGRPVLASAGRGADDDLDIFFGLPSRLGVTGRRSARRACNPAGPPQQARCSHRIIPMFASPQRINDKRARARYVDSGNRHGGRKCTHARCAPVLLGTRRVAIAVAGATPQSAPRMMDVRCSAERRSERSGQSPAGEEPAQAGTLHGLWKKRPGGPATRASAWRPRASARHAGEQEGLIRRRTAMVSGRAFPSPLSAWGSTRARISRNPRCCDTTAPGRAALWS